MNNERFPIDRLQSSPDSAWSSGQLSHGAIPTELFPVQGRHARRIFIGKPGMAYPTAAWLRLRSDHATARDAVYSELDLERDLGEAFVNQWGLYELITLARTKEQFLHQPDLGRSLSEETKSELARRFRRVLICKLLLLMGYQRRQCGCRFQRYYHC